MSQLSTKQIEAQVSAIRRSQKSGSQHYAIRASGDWTGEDRLVIDGQEHLVLSCVSDLQLREALLRAEMESKPSVLLCKIDSDCIGDDVIDRLAKRRVFSPQLREMVAEMFSVAPSRIDPRVLKTKVLMNALLERVPSEGYPSIPSGTLDLQTAWMTLIGCVVGDRVDGPSVTQILEWSLLEDKLLRLTQIDDALKEAFVEWFARSKGDAIRYLMAALDSGYGGDLVPLGIALGLVFDPKHHRNAKHQTARGRLERYFEHREIDADSASSWSRAAEGVIESLTGAEASAIRRPLLKRVDELLGELGIEKQAWISRYAPLGLEQRYEQMGQALLRALDVRKSSGSDELLGGISSIRDHLLGKADSERLARLEMACRLIHWLQTREKESGSEGLDGMVVAYHRNGGFLDWARNRLKESDECSEVRKAYVAILERVDDWAESFEKRFAEQLKDWTRNDRRSDRLTLIEDAIEELAVPIAKQQPVLMLVLDGMSEATFRELLLDIQQHGWTEIVNETMALPRPILATLPSVTAISRRALFLGRLDPATNGTEEGEFRKNEVLFRGSGSQVRPQLFLQGDLSVETPGGVSVKVQDAILDKKCRVVSVVMNAIDDHLDSGKQVDLNWTRNAIRGLRMLLRQASEAQRLVIITSDHGHVLDFGSQSLPSEKDGRGDRYRSATGTLEEGELEFEGKRIYQAMGVERVTLACSANVRYGKDKRGYHGGANPQEVVVPVAVLADVRNSVPEGWAEIPPYEPSWWRIDSAEPRPTPLTKPKPEKAVEGLELFEQAQAKQLGGPAWIAALLESPLYQAEAKRAVRGAPNEERMTKLLTCLEARAGTVVRQALAQELGIPLLRVDGLIQNVGRILNVDGYEVITVDRASDSITLNMDLLRTQFDLKESS